MPTQTKENYLKALYYLHQKNTSISITDLGNEMQVSKSTVNDMVKKLQVKQLVNYERYKPLKLTEKGIEKAIGIIRKHRLSEMFLNQMMGFGWEQVHDIAEEMEHLSSEIFFDRMDELLGFPTQDPHGSPIPDKEGNFIRQDFKILANFKKGNKVILKALKENSRDFMQFLNNKGLTLETIVNIHHVEPFDQSMVVSYKDYPKTTLSHTVCTRLLVEETN